MEGWYLEQNRHLEFTSLKICTTVASNSKHGFSKPIQEFISNLDKMKNFTLSTFVEVISVLIFVLLFHSATFYSSKSLIQDKAERVKRRVCMRLHIEVKSVRETVCRYL